jgi:hypothetical protein
VPPRQFRQRDNTTLFQITANFSPWMSSRGAMLSGILCRIQGYQQDARLRALHDCVLFLQAQKLGLTVLTANVSDFDYLLQLMLTSRVLLYRVAA